MKVLVACEFSGVVRDAFAARGHDAWSCDLLPTEKWGNHIQGDILDLLAYLNDPVSTPQVPRKYPKDLPSKFDLMIAHPPCTYLANSGVCWLYKDPTRMEKMVAARDFFRKLCEADISKICIENPIPHHYLFNDIFIPRYDQIIQPWMFGHPEQKATCLWLKGLPKLTPTNNIKDQMLKLPDNKRQRLHYLPPSKERQTIRSRTFQGIADAMANQWG